MAKYSFEFKMEVVQAYLNGEGGYGYLAKKYNIPSKRPIEYWVRAYKALGTDKVPSFIYKGNSER